MLGGLMGRGEGHPADFEKVVFVVVGEATGHEVHCVKEAAVRHQVGAEVVVAGTVPLATADTVLDVLLGRFHCC